MASAPTVAIVDDDEAVRSATAGLMRSAGYEARTYASAFEFLHDSYSREADCLIADVQMPLMTGIELHESLILAGWTIPVIFITAFRDDTIRDRMLSAGALRFFYKPFDGDSMVQCVQDALVGRDRSQP